MRVWLLTLAKAVRRSGSRVESGVPVGWPAKEPLRPKVSIATTSARDRQASPTVVGETPSLRESYRTVGNCTPIANSPDEINRPIAVVIPGALRSLIEFAISRVKVSLIISQQPIVFR